MDNSFVEAMLGEIQSLINENIIEEQKSGSYFNLLEISGISTSEVKMCKILAEIINPTGTHCQGNVFLRSFIKDVLKIDMCDEELSDAMVYTEYITDEIRRIDIAIITLKRFIPIEVKLYAKDQEKQCIDYFKFAKTKGDISSKVYYLTIDGHLPHETKGLTPQKQGDKIIGYEEVIPLSFKYDVWNWLNNCIETIVDKPILYANLVQFKNALEKLGGNMNKDLNNKITELISENSENIKAAIAIADSVNVAKENLIFKLFKFLETEMKKLDYPLEQLKNKFDYRYNNNYAILNYYNKKTSPALIFRYRQIDDNKEIWFIIELGALGGLYCGFVLAENGENPRRLVLSDDELKKYFRNSFDINKEDWWFYWRYLPFHGEYMPETNPDFKLYNMPYLKLFNDGELERFVNTTMIVISILLQDMIGLTMIEKCKQNVMPKENETFVLKRAFTQEEMNTLKKGHVAREMEDKWCGYYEDGKLYIHRSWAKKCIYVITFDNKNHTHKVVVNRNNTQYMQKNIEKDIQLLNSILNWWTN